MVKLTASEIASLDPDFMEQASKSMGVENTTLMNQMVMYATAESGATFVDNKENPTFMLFLMLGTYKANGERICVILGVHGEHPNSKVAALSIIQFAKENTCKNVGCGTFSGDTDDKLWQHFNTDEVQTVKIHKL